MIDVPGIIANIAYFQSLPPQEIERIVQSSQVIRLNAGDALFHEGEPAKGLYILHRGLVKVVRVSPEGRQLIIRAFHPGETFNEVGALDGTDNAATAVAGEKDTEVILVSGAAIRDLAGRYPELGSAMMTEMARKLRFAMARINRLALMDVKTRLIAFLVESVDESGMLQGYSQEELATRIGTVRQVLGRILGDLQRAGLVQSGRGWIRVIDLKALKDMLPD